MRVDDPLPPEVRQLGRQTAGFWRTTLGLLAALPLAGLAAFSALLAVKAPRPPATVIFAAFACIPAWLCARRVGRTLRMYHGSEEASAIGRAIVVVGSLFAATAVVVVVVIAWLLAELRPRGGEGASKGNLGAIRSALSIYYGDMEGYYPLTVEPLTVSGKYLSSIPKAKTQGRHPDSAHVAYGRAPDDAGGWFYDNVPGDGNYGTLWINCTHTDAKGSAWTTY